MDAQNGWQVLAIATWMLHRSDLNLHDPNSRNCCVEPYAYSNGTCQPNPPPDGPYLRDVEPYLTYDPKVAILTHNSGTCCGSDLQWSVAEEWRSGFVSGAVSNLSQSRIAQAHELGHVMVGVRIGGKERGDYQPDAPENGCRAQRRMCNAAEITAGNCDPDGWKFLDVAERGTFTKEYGALGAREGWADFMAHWAWNDPNGSSCETTDAVARIDYDLDGDNDALPLDPNLPVDWTNPAPVDCHGMPQFHPTPADPTAAWVSDRNWLEDVLDNTAACGPVTGCGTPAGNANMESENRTTVYDWAKMMWMLHAQEGVPVEDLSDLYVDMCPRGWRERDADCSIADDLPLRRLEISANVHGLLFPELFNQISHVEH